MKTRPYIELQERDTILRQLRRRGNWTCRRAGARIRLWTVHQPEAVKIGYQVFPNKHRTVHAIVSTVGKAIEGVNDVLQWRSPEREAPIPTPAPIVAQAVVPQRQEWLPYADN